MFDFASFAINTLPLTPKRLYEEFHLAGLI